MSAADPQLVASNPRVSAFVEANAGSGKTHTLVTRVARLLLRGVKPEAILCVTYTKAAAAEMQTRLFKTLGRWAIARDDDLGRELEEIAETGRDHHRARALFARALEAPGGLKIQTLHGFCEQLLRRFPLEAGVTPGFAVMEDAESELLARQCRQTLAEAALSDPEGALARAYAHFAIRLAPKDFDGMFDVFAGKQREIAAYSHHCGGAVDRDVWRRCGFDAPTTREELEAQYIAGLGGSEWRRRMRELPDFTTAELQKVSGQLSSLSLASSYAQCRKVFLTDEGTSRRFRSKAFQGQFAEWFSDEQDRLIALDERIRCACVAEDTVHALTLAVGYVDLYEGAKSARNALDFDDLVERVKALLTERADAAWVLYKLDGGIDHVLLDEAQDTAPAQWEVLRALTAEFFVGQGQAHERRTMFAVGDEKQSIYSFQGARPERLAVETQAFEAEVTQAGLPFEKVNLFTSRRSSPEILQFVDAVFDDPEAIAGLRTGRGDNIVHFSKLNHQAHRCEDGCVDLWPREVGGEAEEVDPWVPVDAEPGESANKRLASRIARAISEMVGSGAVVIDKESRAPRPMRYGDILILVRRRNVLFDEIIRALKREGAPIAGRDRLKLAEHGAFEDLRALGRFACFPRDDLTLAGLLRSPFCDVSEESLFALAYDRTGTLWTALGRRAGERPEWRAAMEFLGWARAEAASAPFDFYGRVLTRLDDEGRSMRQRILTRLGAEAEEAIDAFLGCALDGETRGERDLERFIAGLDATELEIKREPEPAATPGLGEVRVMTTHGAKGLEAPVVILPDTCTKAKAQLGPLLACEGGGFLWSAAAKYDGEAAKRAREALVQQCDYESLRLLYVALTRARDRLIVCGVEGKQDRNFEGSWYDLIERAKTRLDMHSIPLPGGGEAWRYGEDPYLLGRARDAAPPPTAMPAWARDLAPAEAARPLYASPSTVLEDAAGPVSSPLATVRGLGRFRRGEIIHRLLQLLPDVSPERRADAARRLLSREPGIGDDQREEMTHAALSLLGDERFAAVFGPGSRAEVAVAGSPSGLPDGFAVSGRLDRLVVTPDRVLVVDFKTNRPAPERIEDSSEAYILQMALYRAVLAEAFPGRLIEAALVWTEGPKLMAVPPAMMAGALQRLASDGRTPTSTSLADGVSLK